MRYQIHRAFPQSICLSHGISMTVSMTSQLVAHALRLYRKVHTICRRCCANSMRMAMTNLHLFPLYILMAHINYNSVSRTNQSLFHMNCSKCNKSHAVKLRNILEGPIVYNEWFYQYIPLDTILLWWIQPMRLNVSCSWAIPVINKWCHFSSRIVKNEYLFGDFTICFLMEVLMKFRDDHLFAPWQLQFLLFSKWNHILLFIIYSLIFKEYVWCWRLQCHRLCLSIAWIPFAKIGASKVTPENMGEIDH